MTAMRAGVIGLGAMGLPMARTLAGAGFDVMGFDADPARQPEDVPLAGAIETIAGTCDASLLSLPNSTIVEMVVAEICAHAPSGHLVIDTSTADPASTRRLQAKAAAKGIGYVDAPVSGGAAGAASGQLLVMAGGTGDDLDRAMPVLDALARAVVRCGGPGSGNVAKLINNLLCAAHLSLAGEALKLGDAAGLDAGKLLEVLNLGSGRSAVIEVNLPKWVFSDAYDSGFTMGLMRKDVLLAADLGDLGPMSGMAASVWADSADTLADDADFNRMVDLARSGDARS